MTRLLLTLLLWLIAAPALAQTYTANVQLTIDSTAAGISFTASDILAGSGHPQVNSASCTSNSSGGDFRYRVDGTAPTTTVGVLVPAGGNIVFTDVLSLIAFKGIRTAATSAVLSCTLSSLTAPPVYPVGGGGAGSGSGCVGTAGTPCIVAGGGTAGTPGTAVLTVQGISSGTALNVGNTTVGTNSGVGLLNVPTLPAFASAAAPSWTESRVVYNSTTLGGAQRVMITDAAGAALTVATDATQDAAALTTGPQLMGLGKNTTLPTVVTDGDAVRLLADLQGRLRPKNVCADPELISSVVISTASSGNVELVAISGTTVHVACGFNIIAGGTVGVQFISGTGSACATGETNKTGVYPLIVNSGINSGFGAPIFKGAAGEALCVELSAAVQIDGILTYATVSVP